MNINPEKFDTDLECNLEPFGYIEDSRTIETKSSGKMMLVSFGALNCMGHYAPEFGGVAVVHINPDVLIAVKYIPWSAAERRKELMKQYLYMKENHKKMSPSDITHYFYLNCHYVLPAKKQRLREEYYTELAKDNRDRAKEMQETNQRNKAIQSSAQKGRVAGLNRTMAETKHDDDFPPPPEANVVKKKLPEVKEIKVPKAKTADGEEFISLDEEE